MMLFTHCFHTHALTCNVQKRPDCLSLHLQLKCNAHSAKRMERLLGDHKALKQGVAECLGVMGLDSLGD